MWHVDICRIWLLVKELVLLLWLYSPFLGLGRFFTFLIFYTVGRTPWTGDQLVARPLPTHRTAQTQTSMPRVGFEPTIPVFERAKTVHALDRAVIVIGRIWYKVFYRMSTVGSAEAWSTHMRTSSAEVCNTLRSSPRSLYNLYDLVLGPFVLYAVNEYSRW
jgi:hypothetical protein